MDGQLLEDVVAAITSDKDRWVDVMMKDELNMVKPDKSPLVIGSITFLSFIVVGFIPVAGYIFNYVAGVEIENLFLFSCILTSSAFIIIGYLKALVNQTNKIKGVLETLVLGGTAAALAYFVGDVLEKLFS